MKNIHRAVKNGSKSTAAHQHKTCKPGNRRIKPPAKLDNEALIAAAGMIFGDPWCTFGDSWCTEIHVGDKIAIDEGRKPEPGHLIAIEQRNQPRQSRPGTFRFHRFISFDGRTWTLRGSRGRLLTLRASEASYIGVVTAVTQIQTVLIDRKTFDPWAELAGARIGTE